MWVTIIHPPPDFIIGQVLSDMQIPNIECNREQFNATGCGGVDNIHISRRRFNSVMLRMAVGRYESRREGEGRREWGVGVRCCNDGWTNRETVRQTELTGGVRAEAGF